MRSSALLKWLSIPAVLIGVYLTIRWGTGSDSPRGIEAPPALTQEESKALGVDADSPRDTVATLVGEVKQLRSELESAVSDNKKQKALTDSLKARDLAIDQRIEKAIQRSRVENSGSSDTDRQATRAMIDGINQRLDRLGKPSDAELPVGLGLSDTDSVPAQSDSVLWIEPIGRGAPSPGSAEPHRRETAREVSRPSSSMGIDTMRASSLFPDSKLTPFYTVPSNSTLIGSVAMTALIGRIPIDGTVSDPYPFKALIGADNLTANGIELPNLAGAVVSGTATGDRNLSCVRGQIRSLTFVFRDGTVRTVPDKGRIETSTSQNDENGIGWISDPYGIPCVSGALRSNAQEYLTTQMLITAAGAGAASLIKSDPGNLSFVRGSDGSSIGAVGITADDAISRVIAGGVNEMSQWVGKVYGQAFAAVYVPPGSPVALHIERSLEIDLDSSGRKVNHHTGVERASKLD